MAKIMLVPLDRPDVPQRQVTPRLRSQFVYFASPPGAQGAPELGENEFWFAADDVERWLSDGVFYLVSPLDTANMTEVELSEEQEDWLGWLKDHKVQHVRVVE
jgi:hypothetical protein